MREIKFKFLLENGEVTEPYYLKELIDSDAYINIECEYSSKIKQELQYTGLKDKNGVEIYEGDIMMASYMKKKPCVVEYSKTLAKFTMSGKFNFTAIDSNLEVIGNIYENQELLRED